MHNQRGFTLAEMLVVCAIVGLVMASLLGLVMQGQQAYWFGTTQVDGQQTVRVALERMAKEIREAGYEPLPGDTDPSSCPNATTYPLYTSAGALPCFNFVPIAAQTATALTLQYNFDGSTCVAPCSPINTVALVTDPMVCPAAACRGEQITYSLSGTNLRRQESVVDAAPVVIASGITALTFTYRDDNNNVTAATDLIKVVEISVTAQTATRGAFVTMVDRIRLRNR
ncbi:MAG TPA: prepilin-type N-terminal cleavage/methylation domain-containing protein [Methylomirabilota bacterium]|nr:prepilin-type N-terminal cleavage/methylation domain-containing protein [Methylomirabilota bacterium]